MEHFEKSKKNMNFVQDTSMIELRPLTGLLMCISISVHSMLATDGTGSMYTKKDRFLFLLASL